MVDAETLVVEKTPIHKIWATLEGCVKEGLVKDIGVSNCNTQMLIDLLSYAEVFPVVNQIEVHAYNSQQGLVRFCQKMGVTVTAYSPIGAAAFPGSEKKVALLDNPVLKELADKYGKTPAQVALNWNLRRGVVVIPKTMSKERLTENFGCYSFELSEEDQKRIDELNQDFRLFNPRSWGNFPWHNIPYFE